MLNTKADITFIKKQKTKPYYDSSAITGLVPKLYFKTEKKRFLYNARNLKNHNFEKMVLKSVNFLQNIISRNINNNLNNYKKELDIFLKKDLTIKEHLFLT